MKVITREYHKYHNNIPYINATVVKDVFLNIGKLKLKLWSIMKLKK